MTKLGLEDSLIGKASCLSLPLPLHENVPGKGTKVNKSGVEWGGVVGLYWFSIGALDSGLTKNPINLGAK